MTAARDRFAQLRRDRDHAAELAHIANACSFCGAVHPSITNHGPDGFDRAVVQVDRAPARKRGNKRGSNA